MADPKKDRRFEMLGVSVGATSFNESTHVIQALIDRNKPSYVCIVNVHVLVTAVRHHHFRSIINAADWSFPDGMPLVWYSKHRLGLVHVERVAGPSLMTKCFDELHHVKHFFYGATASTLKNLVSMAAENYSNLNIAGSYSPPFRPLNHVERKEVISRINTLSPDIIWVSLGAPKQEIWMWEMRKEIKRGVMIGVGAAFDYFVGNIKRPPVWIRRSGFEWLCRLYQDPIRLSKRYFITNSLFFFFILKELLLYCNSRKKEKLIS